MVVWGDYERINKVFEEEDEQMGMMEKIKMIEIVMIQGKVKKIKVEYLEKRREGKVKKLKEED